MSDPWGPERDIWYDLPYLQCGGGSTTFPSYPYCFLQARGLTCLPVATLWKVVPAPRLGQCSGTDPVGWGEGEPAQKLRELENCPSYSSALWWCGWKRDAPNYHLPLTTCLSPPETEERVDPSFCNTQERETLFLTRAALSLWECDSCTDRRHVVVRKRERCPLCLTPGTSGGWGNRPSSLPAAAFDKVDPASRLDSRVELILLAETGLIQPWSCESGRAMEDLSPGKR